MADPKEERLWRWRDATVKLCKHKALARYASGSLHRKFATVFLSSYLLSSLPHAVAMHTDALLSGTPEGDGRHNQIGPKWPSKPE